jgi:CheY-like chemotaxis protein/two-component sensor histidine kinase
VLELSRIDSGAFDIEIEPIDLNSLLSNVVQLYTPLAFAKKLELVLEAEPILPRAVLGDESRIRQVLSNLLSNAIKFTRQGTVTLRCRAKAEGDKRWHIQFTVEDTGIGIEAEVIPNLFNHFTQASLSIHKEFGGTGLGLSISRKLVDLMGGNLVARSQVGRGSEFEINLHVAEPLQASQDTVRSVANPEQNQQATSLTGLRALVVDDNLVNRTLLASFLKRLSINASLACDGSEALQVIASQGPFDLVFMDMIMPSMDGLEATRHIRQLPAAQPYICGLSANAFKTDRDKCLAEGMNDFLEKPLSFDRFCEFMRNELPHFHLKQHADLPKA